MKVAVCLNPAGMGRITDNMPPYTTALFMFRRDLRLVDNSGLNLALQCSQRVVACFVFDPKQIKPHPYQSLPGLHFLLRSVQDLQQRVRQQGGELVLFHGTPVQAVHALHRQNNIQAVFVNRDYTPFSRQRDQKLAGFCASLGLDFHSQADALLTEPEQVLSQNQKPYSVFTAFYHKAKQLPVLSPQDTVSGVFAATGLAAESDHFPSGITAGFAEPLAGRAGAVAALKNLARCRQYQAERDVPALAATSGLSVHLKFGTCSVREAYFAVIGQLGPEHPLLRQLYWRDFFTHTAFHYPGVFGQEFLEKYRQLPWSNNDAWFAAWCSGQTGFPLVDAGMRQLNATGLMHNRLRMLTACFLVKDLDIDWRWGERYFAQKLLDYDPCVNNGNWQWAASTGCDAQPYFRIFNPWLQQKKFDTECAYIYQWLPELRTLPAKTLHQWHKTHQGSRYPAPIVDHSQQARAIKAKFQAVG